MLQPTDKAPMDILVKDIDGNEISLSKLATTQYLLIYFYPKDDTPGCTTEACELRDFNEDIKKLGVTVLGVSKDSVKSHNKFKTKHSLNFDLLSDEDHKLQEAFGVWQLKKFMGKEYMGTARTTFLLDKDGTVVKVWENVKPEGHAKAVYEYIKNNI